jgi:hypothetical protein
MIPAFLEFMDFPVEENFDLIYPTLLSINKTFSFEGL